MSDSSPTVTDQGEAGQYVAEYTDGPLAGTTEHRYLADGAPEPRITQMGLVEGTDALFEYVAGEQREVNGQPVVLYAFDQGDSDARGDQADHDAESHRL